MDTTEFPKVCVVMRSYNDRDLIEGTLNAVLSQDYPNFELWNFDSTSNDGTLEVIRQHNVADRIILNDSKTYNPGTVLNDAMNRTDSNIVVFINSDATPERTDWLRLLVTPMLEDEGIAAVYGRQTSRSDCRSLFVKDNERAFGDGSISAKWMHFFSMANSAVRRSVYEVMPFETAVQYSEDIEWTYRARKAGWKIHYVEEAAATHSHNYTLKQSYKRHFGEGKADAWIFKDQSISSSPFSYVLMPATMEVLRDLKWAITTGSIDAFIHSVPLRFTQRYGRWKGLKEGKVTYGV